jgi:exodeoxyribonuclease VII small subunit
MEMELAEKRKSGGAGDLGDVAALTFEDALQELEKIVSQLESGSVGLEQSIEIYERGAALKSHCESKLKTAQAKIEKIVVSPDGAISAEQGNLD